MKLTTLYYKLKIKLKEFRFGSETLENNRFFLLFSLQHKYFTFALRLFPINSYKVTSQRICQEGLIFIFEWFLNKKPVIKTEKICYKMILEDHFIYRTDGIMLLIDKSDPKNHERSIDFIRNTFQDTLKNRMEEFKEPERVTKMKENYLEKTKNVVDHHQKEKIDNQLVRDYLYNDYE